MKLIDALPEGAEERIKADMARVAQKKAEVKAVAFTTAVTAELVSLIRSTDQAHTDLLADVENKLADLNRRVTAIEERLR